MNAATLKLSEKSILVNYKCEKLGRQKYFLPKRKFLFCTLHRNEDTAKWTGNGKLVYRE